MLESVEEPMSSAMRTMNDNLDVFPELLGTSQVMTACISVETTCNEYDA